MLLALQVFGVAILGSSIWACNRNRRLPASAMSPLSRRLRLGVWLLALPLGVASLFFRYPLEGQEGHYYTIYGVPFAAAAFDEKGLDYVSSFTVVFMLCNFVAWALLPQLLFWLAVTRRIHRQSSPEE